MRVKASHILRRSLAIRAPQGALVIWVKVEALRCAWHMNFLKQAAEWAGCDLDAVGLLS